MNSFIYLYMGVLISPDRTSRRVSWNHHSYDTVRVLRRHIGEDEGIRHIEEVEEGEGQKKRRGYLQ